MPDPPLTDPRVSNMNPKKWAQLLQASAQGHALWHAAPGSRGGGTVGDCGFINGGRFIKMFNIFDDDNVVGIDPRQYSLTHDDICHESKENVFPLRYSSKIHSMQLGIDLRTGPLIIPTPITTTLSAGVRSESEQMAFLAFCGPTTTTSRYDKTRTLERYLIAEHTRIINYFRDQYPVSISNIVILQCRTTAASWVGGIASSRQVGVQGGLSLGGADASLGVVASEQHGWQLTHGDRLWGEEQTLDWQPCIVVQPLKLRKRERLISRLSNAVPTYGSRAQQSTLINPHRIGTGSDIVVANSGMHGSAVFTLGANLSQTGFEVCLDDEDGSDQSDEPLVDDEHGLLDELLDFVLDSWPEADYAIGGWETVVAYAELHGDLPQNWYTKNLVTAVIETSSEIVGTVAHLVALRARGAEPPIYLTGTFNSSSLTSVSRSPCPDVLATNAQALQVVDRSGSSINPAEEPSATGSGTPSRQTPKACSTCKARHLKCDGLWPRCGTCKAASLSCRWGPAITPVSCTICRRGHNKCDGKMPICGPCRTHRRECSYSLAADRRRRPGAALQELANEKILALEAEIEGLRELLRAHNIVDAHRPPALMLKMPHADLGGSDGAGPAFRGTPMSPALSDCWTVPTLSPTSTTSALSSPPAQYPIELLDEPFDLATDPRVTPGECSMDEDADQLPRDGHIEIPHLDMYMKSMKEMQDGTQVAAVTLTTAPVGAAAPATSFDDDAPGPVSFPSKSPSAPRKHTGTACTICRRGHHKCDGKTPVCGPCRTHRRECSYSLAEDRRRRPGAGEQQRANDKIRALEDEIARLRELLRAHNIVDAHRPPTLMLTVPDADFGGSGGTNPPPSGEFLDVPMGLHGRVGGRYGTDDEMLRDGHMGLPLPTPAWPGIPPSTVGVTALTMNLSAVVSNAPERRADIGLAYADSGPGLIAPGVVQGYGMPAGSFDVDTSMLFRGTSMDAAFRNEQ